MTGRQVERNNAIDSMNDAQLASTPMYSDTLGLYNTRMNNSDQSNTEEKTDKQTLEGEHDRPIYRVTTYDGFPGTNDRSKKEIEVYDREKFIKALDPFKNGSTKQQLINLDGKEKVLKFGNSKHVQTEVLTAKLYKEVGAPTLNVDLIEVCGGDEKRLALISDYVPTPNDGKTLEPKLIELRNSPDFRRHVAADMIFANWNMCEKNNWIEVDSRMLRADTGGALDFCAQGSNEKKENLMQMKFLRLKG
jgi:hypothetical protein